ncbi:MAG: hypothetical protein Kow0027_02860 [Saprospiraceae bacterium]
MKYLLYPVFALLLVSFVSTPTDKEVVELNCQLNACEKVDQLHLFEFNGVNFTKIGSAPTTDWQNYKFQIPASGPRFYYVGIDANNLKPLILGTEKSISLKGSCSKFQNAQLPDSDLNQKYEAVKQQINQHKNQLTTYLRQLQIANQQNNVETANQIILKMKELDEERLHYIETLKKESPFLAKVAAINTYLSYHNHGTSGETELDYFGTKYFQLVDWNDPDYEYNAWVFEATKDYAQTLANIKLPVDQQKNFIDLQLSKIPQEKRTYMLALGGMIAGLQSGKSPLMATYAKKYIEMYGAKYPEAAAQLKNAVKATSSMMPGAEAPDFTMNTPDGQPLSLKDLRGKVLLIDFWASWCGPCRRENPNVVKAYNKYHDKGFDVLGVSLDKDKKRWLDAIEKDGLIWHHVSDLKGWANAAAQLYGVRSIPHTVLLDKDGKIIARNLRGPELEQKLAELFGE